jgi:hypothetical protein
MTLTPVTPVTLAGAASVDPDVAALFADIETILLEAALRVPAETSVPSSIGCAVRGWSSPGRCGGVSTGAWRAPSHPIRAVQRSPPVDHRRAHVDDIR